MSWESSRGISPFRPLRDVIPKSGAIQPGEGSRATLIRTRFLGCTLDPSGLELSHCPKLAALPNILPTVNIQSLRRNLRSQIRMSEVAVIPHHPDANNGSPEAPSVEVYAVYGVEPEIQAYAMAKYSRSALSMKESLKEISQQKAEKFLNTFYFQYGHRSIADLAHIALAIERLSILAAIAVADEQRWDGQERSTRYQDFKKSGYFTPDFGDDQQARTLYRETIEGLFAEYESLSEHMSRFLVSITPKPAEMKQEAYDRTLRARAFDISRYLLPLATNTSLGEIVNARTLESQVSHLLAHTHKEVRNLGELLKQAATSPAYNVNEESLRELVTQIRAVSPELARAGRARAAARSSSGADLSEIRRSE